MAKNLKFEEKPSDLDLAEFTKLARKTIKAGPVTIIPNIHAELHGPVLWVSAADFMRLKAEMGKRERSGAV